VSENYGEFIFRFSADFKKEDIAAAWLLHHVSAASADVFQKARELGVRHVFIGGSFPNRDCIRALLTRQFTKSRLRWEHQEADKKVRVWQVFFQLFVLHQLVAALT
jgi:hypothetical protein